MNEMSQFSIPYKALCTEYYELDKPEAPQDALACYLEYAQEAHGAILEPMCGTGNFFIPLLERGYTITGFDSSPHMLDVCRRKCHERQLASQLLEASFETFALPESYQLIFIPSGSFCLLIDSEQVRQALTCIVDHLNVGGKFVFDIETLQAISEQQGTWKGSWVEKSDHSKVVLSTLSHFNPQSRIETTLCRYDLWKGNSITQTEVEDFHLRLYEMSEIEQLLEQYGLKIIRKRQPYTHVEAHPASPVVLYECIKTDHKSRDKIHKTLG